MVSPRRLASVLVAPSGFRVASLYISAASLASMEGNLAAIGFVLGERDGLHIDPSHALRIDLRIIQETTLIPDSRSSRTRAFAPTLSREKREKSCTKIIETRSALARASIRSNSARFARR